jgi:acetoin utilization protein AcuC
MACTVHVAWDERLTGYHFGPEHPMAPIRVELTMRLAHEFGLWAQPGVTLAARPRHRRRPATGARRTVR